MTSRNFDDVSLNSANALPELSVTTCDLTVPLNCLKDMRDIHEQLVLDDARHRSGLPFGSLRGVFLLAS
jgi:hypothetical protein